MPRIYDLVNKLAEYKVFSKFDLKHAYHQIELLEYDKKYTTFEANGELLDFNRLPFCLTNGVPIQQRCMDDMVDKEDLKKTHPYRDDVFIGGKNQLEHDQNVEKFRAAARRINMTLNEGKTVSSVG